MTTRWRVYTAAAAAAESELFAVAARCGFVDRFGRGPPPSNSIHRPGRARPVTGVVPTLTRTIHTDLSRRSPRPFSSCARTPPTELTSPHPSHSLFSPLLSFTLFCLFLSLSFFDSSLSGTRTRAAPDR